MSARAKIQIVIAVSLAIMTISCATVNRKPNDSIYHTKSYSIELSGELANYGLSSAEERYISLDSNETDFESMVILEPIDIDDAWQVMQKSVRVSSCGRSVSYSTGALHHCDGKGIYRLSIDYTSFFEEGEKRCVFRSQFQVRLAELIFSFLRAELMSCDFELMKQKGEEELNKMQLVRIKKIK